MGYVAAANLIVMLPAAAGNVTVTPTTLALALTAFAPVIGFGIVPSTLALALTSYAPALDLGVIPVTLALILATYTPDIVTGGGEGVVRLGRRHGLLGGFRTRTTRL